MAQHRRNSSFVGISCADPRNSKSMSFTARGDHSAGILRQHDILGVLPILSFFLAQKMLTSPTENSENSALIAKIEITVIIVL